MLPATQAQMYSTLLRDWFIRVLFSFGFSRYKPVHHDAWMLQDNLEKTSCFTSQGVYQSIIIYFLGCFENEGGHSFLNKAKLLKTQIEKSAVRSFLFQRPQRTLSQEIACYIFICLSSIFCFTDNLCRGLRKTSQLFSFFYVDSHWDDISSRFSSYLEVIIIHLQMF